ncbi:MAG: beta-lactamase family protein [Flavobacteriales bacterium]|nr:beta-lactamase family protein [Flavobacteriales bacterium]
MKYKFNKLFYILTIGAIILIGAGCNNEVKKEKQIEIADDFNKNKLDSLFTAINDNDAGFGSVSIVRNGNNIYSKSIGYQNIDSDLKTNKDTKFKIASITKTYTATIIMLLIEEEKLRLTTHLNEFFPNIVNSEIITIEQMLQHRSGIQGFASNENIEEFSSTPISSADLVKKIETYESDFEPGSKFMYSNPNYCLLGFIAEEIEKKSLGEVMQERIFDPLSLKDTYYGKLPKLDNVAISYFNNEGWVQATDFDLSVISGAGGITSTATDVNIFFNALFAHQIVTKNSLQLMTKMNEGYGFGLLPYEFGEKTAIGHHGFLDGFLTKSIYFVDDNVSIVYLANGVDMKISKIVEGVAAIYFNEPYKIPSFEPTEKLSSEILSRYEGVYHSEDIPINITVSHQDGLLFCRGTGQNASSLAPIEEHHFKNETSGLEIFFGANNNEFRLQQGDVDLTLTKFIYDEEDLSQYIGVYEMANNPQETATIKVNDNKLLITATWQGENKDYSVWVYQKNKFSGLEIDLAFNIINEKLIIEWSEGQESYQYKRKNGNRFNK